MLVHYIEAITGVSHRGCLKIHFQHINLIHIVENVKKNMLVLIRISYKEKKK